MTPTDRPQNPRSADIGIRGYVISALTLVHVFIIARLQNLCQCIAPNSPRKQKRNEYRYENDNKGLDYLSYESALSAGIAAALELIENNKNN